MWWNRHGHIRRVDFSNWAAWQNPKAIGIAEIRNVPLIPVMAEP